MDSLELTLFPHSQALRLNTSVENPESQFSVKTLDVDR
jgi:hypothetical protein